MNKPYHERPDWILKSIVYYCDNYKLDGEDLRKYKRGAIAWFKNHRRDLQNGIFSAFDWSNSPQGDDFWVYLWNLQVHDIPFSSTDALPWTDYEKRKIAKMPRVK